MHYYTVYFFIKLITAQAPAISNAAVKAHAINKISITKRKKDFIQHRGKLYATYRPILKQIWSFSASIYLYIPHYLLPARRTITTRCANRTSGTKNAGSKTKGK